MKFYESGIVGNKTIMLLPGNFMTHRQFEVIAPKLADEYHVICVDFDGYDETGETTYTTAEDQARKLHRWFAPWIKPICPASGISATPEPHRWQRVPNAATTGFPTIKRKTEHPGIGADFAPKLFAVGHSPTFVQ